MMRSGLIASLVVAGLLLAPRQTHADEGMYLLYETLPMAKLKKRGLELTGKQLRQLAPAIVQLARGGTGSFVSSKGLIVTNHHVAYRCLARLSATTHKGILKRGHVAKSLKTEVACPSYDLLAVISVQDVTKGVLSAVKPTMRPGRRAKALTLRTRTLEAACEKAGRRLGHAAKGGDRICQVRALNGGVGYVLSKYKRIRDVRLVYAPPLALGNYGGDVDNWRYPRHTADFTFLRAYVSPKGEGAVYSATNVPYKPKRYLKVATSGVKRGQWNMVLGFPWRTTRHATYARARFYRDHQAARRVKLFRKLLAVLPKKGLTARRYRSIQARLSNSRKYYADSIRQFAQFKLLTRKKRARAVLQSRIDRSPTLKKQHGKLLTRIDTIYARLGKWSHKMTALRYLPYFVGSLRTAMDIIRWSKQRSLPDLERRGERYRDKNIYRVYRASMGLEHQTTLEGEKGLLVALLGYADGLPGKQQLKTVRWLKGWAKRALRGLRRKAKRSKKPYAEVYAAATRGAKPTPNVLRTAVDLVYGGTRLYAADVSKVEQRSKALWARSRLLRPTILGPCTPEHGWFGSVGRWHKDLGACDPEFGSPIRDPVQKIAEVVRLIELSIGRLEAALSEAPVGAKKAQQKRRRKLQRKLRRARRKIKGARRRMTKAISRAVRRSRDPLLLLAGQLVREAAGMDKGPLKQWKTLLGPILRPRLVKEVIRPRYWDANFTLRLSYGTVADYRSSRLKKRWRYVSRLTWLIKKGTGKRPFLVPKRLQQAYAKKKFGRWYDKRIRDVPVNFTTTLDTTGGNSGSPVLNGKGELIGLLFDGTPESILSDWQYLGKVQRSICVDIRFVLFLAEKVDRATHVLKELGLTP